MTDTALVKWKAEGARHAADTAAQNVARRLAVPRLAPVHIAVVVAASDVVTCALAFWFAQFVIASPNLFDPGAAALSALLAAFCAVAATAAGGGYALGLLRSRLRGLAVFALAALVAVLALLAVQGPARTEPTLIAAACAWLVLPAPVRLCLRMAIDWAVASGLTGRRAVIAGGGPEADRVVRGLSARPGNDIRVHAIFDDRGPDRAGTRVLDVPVIGRFDDLVTFCRQAEIDVILLTLPPEAEARIATLLDRFRVLPVQVHLTAWSGDLRFPDSSARPAVSQLLPPSFRPERRLAKRAFDLVVGVAAVAVLAPVMLAVACAIKLDSAGPVLFRQRRHGFNHREITVWKFRTMFTDDCDPAAIRVVTKDDPRVTRVGRILRKTSLDELPQLFNVLGGTLSLVGPRPHALAARSSRREAFEQIVEGYSARHRLPPGITGWAQINGLRGEVDAPEALRARVDHDLYYIENWSLWLDLTILARTPLSLFDTRRAY